MPRRLILRTEFNRLYRDLKELLKPTDSPNSNLTDEPLIILGARNHEQDDTTSIRTLLDAIKPKKKSITYVNYLHELLTLFKNHKEVREEEVMIGSIDVFAKLLGHSKFEDYLKAVKKKLDPPKEYICLYYSEGMATVRDFSFTLSKNADESLSASAKGYHDNVRELELTGEPRLVGSCLNIYLEGEQNHSLFFLNFSLHLENYNDPEIRSYPKPLFLQGIVTANSSHTGGYPITMECILIDKTHVEKESLNAYRYLHLRNNTFRVISDPNRQSSTEKLQIHRNNMDSFKYIANKKYRIWIYGEKSIPSKTGSDETETIIFQSCLDIDDHCKATMEIPLVAGDTKTQSCHIIPNDLHGLRIIVLVYKENALTTFSIFNIPKGIEREIIHGAYSTEARRNETGPRSGPRSGYFVMMEEKEKCAVKIFNMTEIVQEIANDQQLKKMKEKLDSYQ